MKKVILTLVAALIMIVAAQAQTADYITVPYRSKVDGAFVQLNDTIYTKDFAQYGFKLDTAKVVFQKILNQEGAIGQGRGYIVVSFSKNNQRIFEAIYNEKFKREELAFNPQLFNWK